MKCITTLFLFVTCFTEVFATSAPLDVSGGFVATAANTAKPTTKKNKKKKGGKSKGLTASFSMPNMPSLTNLPIDFSKFDIDTVMTNVVQSDKPFLQRGELYFVAQAGLIICVLLGEVPGFGSLKIFVGPSCFFGGLAIAALALTDLGSDSLSPFPATTKTSTLKTTGIYKEMRHPMYSGLLLVLFGLTILTNSADRLILTMALAYLLEMKSNKEEEFLMESFGEDYEAYKEQVPEKFIPVTLAKEMPWNK